MLKHNMVLLAPDVNTGGESSTSPDVKVTESSSVETTDVNESAEETVTETTVSEDTATEESSAEEQVEQSNETNVEEDTTTETEAAIPYERFKEINDKKSSLERDFEASKPLIEQAKTLNDFMRDNQVPPQELQNALTYLSLLRRDPKAAYEMLRPTYEQLATFAGERLPADLQADVIAGTLSEQRAKELASARAQQSYAQWRGQQASTVQQQQSGDAVATTTSVWVQQKSQIDPDLKSGSPLWEQVDLRLRALSSAKPARDAATAMANCEQAYTDAKKFMSSLQPRSAAPVKKALKSQNTASGNKQVIKTAEDVMKAIQRGVKPHEMRYA